MTKLKNTDAQEMEDIELETLNVIFKGQKDKVKKPYRKAENLSTKGSDFTRSPIANISIFPLSQLLEMNYSWGHEYLKLFSPQLKAEYSRQIFHL